METKQKKVKELCGFCNRPLFIPSETYEEIRTQRFNGEFIEKNDWLVLKQLVYCFVCVFCARNYTHHFEDQGQDVPQVVKEYAQSWS